jgi:hypothetical protein
LHDFDSATTRCLRPHPLDSELHHILGPYIYKKALVMTDDTGKSAQRRVARQQPVERITIALISKAAADLQRTQDRTGLSKTDIVNRAISVYEFLESQLLDGSDLLIRDRRTGEIQLIRFL